MPKGMHEYIRENKVGETYGLAHNQWHSSQEKKNVIHTYEVGKNHPEPIDIEKGIDLTKMSEDIKSLSLTGKVKLDEKNQYVLEKEDGSTIHLRHDGLNINPWARRFEDLPQKVEYVRVKGNGSLVMGKHDKIEDNKTVPQAALKWALSQTKEGMTSGELADHLENIKGHVETTIGQLWEENNKVYSGKSEEADFKGVFERMHPEVQNIGNTVKQAYDQREAGKDLDLSQRTQITGGKFVPELGDEAVYDIEAVPGVLEHIIKHLRS